MVPAFKRDEARAGDQTGQQATLFERHYDFVAAVQYQRRDLDLLQKIHHIYLAQLIEESNCILWRGRDTMKVIEPLPLLRRRVGHVERGPELTKSRIVLAPAKLDERVLGLPLLDHFGR